MGRFARGIAYEGLWRCGGDADAVGDESDDVGPGAKGAGRTILSLDGTKLFTDVYCGGDRGGSGLCGVPESRRSPLEYAADARCKRGGCDWWMGGSVCRGGPLKEELRASGRYCAESRLCDERCRSCLTSPAHCVEGLVDLEAGGDAGAALDSVGKG